LDRGKEESFQAQKRLEKDVKREKTKSPQPPEHHKAHHP
jgi:hypothetical protein